MSPQRIQLRRTKGWRKPEGAVVVARPSKWGNPFQPIPEVGTGVWRILRRTSSGLFLLPDTYPDRDTTLRAVIRKYRQMVVAWVDDDYDGDHTEAFAELTGHDLACWCPLDQHCHADVLVELANR